MKNKKIKIPKHLLNDDPYIPMWAQRKNAYIVEAMMAGFSESQAEFLYNEFNDLKEI